MKVFTKKSLSQSLFFLYLIVVFISCENNKEKTSTEEKFIRDWESVKMVIPHKSYLKIKSNHTFEYNDAGCQWQTNSLGNWKVVNDTLILNSIPSNECQFTNGFGNNFRTPTKDEDFYLETTIIRM